jgi:enoyl-CoA hydratase
MNISLEHRNEVALLTLRRPPVNALDLPMILALEQVFLKLAQERPKGLVLTSEGPAFCAGVDTKAFAGYRPIERKDMVLAITRMVGALYSLDLPTVAAVAGYALGGGFVLMLGCDVRLVTTAPVARFGLTEAKAGVPFPAGPLEVIRAELPVPALGRLVLTSMTICAAEVVALGVAEPAEREERLVEQALQRAGELAAQPAFSVVKRQLRAPVVSKLAELIDSKTDTFLAAFGA